MILFPTVAPALIAQNNVTLANQDETSGYVESILKAAEQGDADAQYSLGQMFLTGNGVTQDAGQAAYWLRKAAEQGAVIAQYKLGEMYMEGNGVTQDVEQATYWFRRAASAQTAQAPEPAPSAHRVGETRKDKFIAVSSTTMNWSDAKAFCQQKGGRLPRMNNSDSWAWGNHDKITHIDGFGAPGALWPSDLPGGSYWAGTEDTDVSVLSWLVLGGDGGGVIDFGGKVHVGRANRQSSGSRVVCVQNRPSGTNDTNALDERQVAMPPKIGMIWLVEPTLSYDSIWYCRYCDALGKWKNVRLSDREAKLHEILRSFTYSSAEKNLSICQGHGGGIPRFKYDEKKGLYGEFYSDEGGQTFTMQRRDAFFQKNMRIRLLAFQKIDSDKVRTIQELDGPLYDFSGAYINSKYALVYNGEFITDFIYSNYDENSPPDTIAVSLNNKWGILDKNGNTLIPFELDHITFINNDVAFAKYNGKYGILSIK
jgi:TPR repeat protein